VIKPSDTTLDAWIELAEVMEKHGFHFDMFKPYAGKGKRICLNSKYGFYFVPAIKKFTASDLKEYAESMKNYKEPKNYLEDFSV
jgi:hypothetical protein